MYLNFCTHFAVSTRALFSSRRRLFTPFCLNSWKGLKNTKHLMVIKVAHMHIAFVLALNAFPFLSWKYEMKKKKHTNSHKTKQQLGGLSGFIVRQNMGNTLATRSIENTAVYSIAYSLTVLFSLGIDGVFVLLLFDVPTFMAVAWNIFVIILCLKHSIAFIVSSSLMLWFFISNLPQSKKLNTNKIVIKTVLLKQWPFDSDICVPLNFQGEIITHSEVQR